MTSLARTFLIALACLFAVSGPGRADHEEEDAPPAFSGPMTMERIGALIVAVDPDAQNNEGRAWQLTIEGLTAVVVMDPNADRMRIMTPIAKAGTVGEAMLKRLMQANYDSALDARYAIAQDVLWGVFIHPLSSLNDDLFLSGLGQTINVARTYGTSFQSGALTYGGGDSQELLGHLLIEQLKKKGSTL